MLSLITGGAGLIGSHIAQHCLDIGHEVIVLDDLSGGLLENVPKGVHFIKGSITDDGLITKLFEKYEFDYIYHLAAYASVGLSHFVRKFNYENNVIGSINLINAAIKHKIKCFVFTSSTAVYGSNQPPYNEDMTPLPVDPYGIAKLTVELDLEAAQTLFGLNYIIFRPHNVFGEHQNIRDPYRNVVGVFIRQILSNEPLTIFGNGNQQRAFSYVRDISPIISESINNKGLYNDVYNIGSDIPISINDLIHYLAKIMGKKPKINHFPPVTEQLNSFANHNKINQFYKNIPKTSLEVGLTNMVSWVQDIGIIGEKTKYCIELTTKLPKYWKES